MIHSLELADISSRLVEKAVDVYLISGREVVSRWFHSGDDLDCMIWFSEQGDLVRFQINLHGQIVDWNQALMPQPLHTGFISEEEIRYAGGAIQVVERVVYDDFLNRSSVETMLELVGSASAFTLEWKAQITAALRPALNATECRRLANTAPKSTREPFWQRLKRWAVR